MTFGGFTLGFQGVALVLQQIEIGRDGQFHVQEHGLGQGRQAVGQLAVGLGAVEQALGALGDHGADQFLGHQGVAADVPLRLQVGVDVGAADPFDVADIGVAVIGLGDPTPVSGLRALGAGHVGVIAKLGAGLGKGPHLIIELVERPGDLGVDHRLDRAQGRTRTLVEAHEGHTLIQLRVRAHAFGTPTRW
jgi:hypothetical protein